MQPDEEPLTGGNVSVGVVRVGGTVRKPASPASPAVEALLRHLEAVGFDGAPRALGYDSRGRQVLEYVDGPIAHTLGLLSPAGLRRVGALIRDLHQACASFEPPAEARWEVLLPADREELICHHDLAPWNLVLAEDRWVFIDWDGLGPGTRLWDLGYAAHGFVGLAAGNDPHRDAPRLAALAAGYGLTAEERVGFPEQVEGHTRAMYQLLCDGAATGQQPWARLHAEGHADHWGPAADYIGSNRELWRAALAGR